MGRKPGSDWSRKVTSIRMNKEMHSLLRKYCFDQEISFGTLIEHMGAKLLREKGIISDGRFKLRPRKEDIERMDKEIEKIEKEDVIKEEPDIPEEPASIPKAESSDVRTRFIEDCEEPKGPGIPEEPVIEHEHEPAGGIEEEPRGQEFDIGEKKEAPKHVGYG